MFKEIIKRTPFVGQVEADDCFAQISGNNFHGDETMVSTLRALIYPRKKEEESLEFQYLEMQCGDPDGSVFDQRLLNGILRRVNFRIGYFSLINLEYGVVAEDWDFIRNHFEDYFAVNDRSDWVYLPKVSDFFRNTIPCLCFINQKEHGVILFASFSSSREYHYLQCGIFAMFPWWFDPSKGLDNDEMALVNSFRSKDSKEYMRCTEKLASRYNFRDIRVKRLLNDFERRGIQSCLDNVRGQISDDESRIRHLNDQVNGYVEERNRLLIEEMGLLAKINTQGDSELMDYFLRNKNLSLVSSELGSITFVCSGYVSYWDEEMARTMINNPDSYLYSNADCSAVAQDLHDFMTAVFIDQTLKMKFCSGFSLVIRGGVRALSQDDINYGAQFDDCMPNPHHNQYSCLGNYMAEINNCMMDNDYVGAIEQCMAATMSLNFGDSAVMRTFVGYILGKSSVNTRCVETHDGRIMTPFEVMQEMRNKSYV